MDAPGKSLDSLQCSETLWKDLMTEKVRVHVAASSSDIGSVLGLQAAMVMMTVMVVMVTMMLKISVMMHCKKYLGGGFRYSI